MKSQIPGTSWPPTNVDLTWCHICTIHPHHNFIIWSPSPQYYYLIDGSFFTFQTPKEEFLLLCHNQEANHVTNNLKVFDPSEFPYHIDAAKMRHSRSHKQSSPCGTFWQLHHPLSSCPKSSNDSLKKYWVSNKARKLMEVTTWRQTYRMILQCHLHARIIIAHVRKSRRRSEGVKIKMRPTFR